MRTRLISVFVAVTCLAIVVTVPASILHVATSGSDSDVCGGTIDPCRSISQAIANAATGDQIIVGPGTYNSSVESVETGSGTCDCMINIDKSISIESSQGAASTILDAGLNQNPPIRVVVVSDHNVQFGKINKGFTLLNARREGLLSQDVNGVWIEGNIARGNGSLGNNAFNISGEGITVLGNQAIRNFRAGFGISGQNQSSIANAAIGNLLGIDGGFGGEIAYNTVSGNESNGLDLSNAGLDYVVHHNRITYNQQSGVNIRSSVNAVIMHNNIFGNVSCGINNESGNILDATGNYWGATTGPGPDPADLICNDASSSTDYEPFATVKIELAQCEDELSTVYACIPEYEKENGTRCRDGEDNDCDGLVDEADPDCQK